MCQIQCTQQTLQHSIKFLDHKFTKEEFLKSVYGGLKKGIVRFENKNQKNTLQIILNNGGGDKDDQIGKKVVARLQALK